MFKTLASVACIGALSLGSALAAPVTVDFESEPVGPVTGPISGVTITAVDFASDPLVLSIFDTFETTSGTQYLTTGVPGFEGFFADDVITFDFDTAIDFFSIKIVGTLNFPEGGIEASAGMMSASSVAAGTLPIFGDPVFDLVLSGLGGVTQVVVAASAIGSLDTFQLDDLVFEVFDEPMNEVPLPAGALLFLSGAAGFSAVRRRRSA